MALWKKKNTNSKNKEVLFAKYLSDQKVMEKEKDEASKSQLEKEKSDKANAKRENYEKKKELKKLKRLEKKNQEKPKKEKKKTEPKERVKNKLIEGKISVAIMTLNNTDNTGCRHIAITIATYMMHIKKKVCIVNYSNKKIELSECRIYTSKNELSKDYDMYDCVIYIVGDNSNFSCEDFVFSNYKIVMCLDQEEYKKKLYTFITRYDKDAKFYYIFNFVTEKNVKNVHALMEDYYHICMPLYSLDNKKMIMDVAHKIFNE